MNKFGHFFKTSGGGHLLKTRRAGSHDLFYSERVHNSRADKFPVNRFIALLLFVTAFFFFLTARLIYLQIFRAKEYQKIADGNRIFSKRKIARRGIILDRFGKALVLNEPKFILRKNNKIKKISEKEALQLAAKKPDEFNSVEIAGVRKYLMPQEMSHIIGYLGEINSEELKNPEFSSYLSGDQIGRSGIEEEYESVLSGKNGEEYYEVQSNGEIVNKLGEKAATPGQDIKLTIDSDLQKTAFSALQSATSDPRYQGGKQIKGAVIVSSVSSGEILAMVSLPSYDPIRPGDYIHDDKNYPLMNRAVSATYPPGSTFKLVVATGGLESGRVKASTSVEDVGVIKIGQWEFPTWSSVRDGMMDIVKGIKRSNDIFFYKAGEMTGLEKIREYAKKYGVGDKLGIDLPAESSGNLPSDEWKFKVAGEHWYLGDTYHLAIGQGYILATPLQVNMWTNAIASRGKLYRPHVVLNSKFEIRNSKQIINSNDKNSKRLSNGTTRLPARQVEQLNNDARDEYLIRDLHLRKETIDLIWRGMREACQTGGTGWPLFDFPIPVACKTGTAEHLEGEATHAWFTAFAPASKPEIAVTVLIENGGQGSDVAAPVARKVMEKYFGVQ